MSTQCRKYPKMKEDNHDPQICGFQAPKTYKHDKPTCKCGNLGLHRFHHWNCSRALLRCNPAANDVAGNTLDTLHGLVPWEDALQAWNEGLEP